MKSRFSLCLFFLLALLSLCASCSDDAVVAKVGKHKLYEVDLRSVIPLNTPYRDSVAIANQYIESWIRRQLLLDEARKVVDRDYDAELAAYRESLLCHDYEQIYLRQHLDTNVSNLELERFFQSHFSDFILSESLVKVVVCKAPAGGTEEEALKHRFASSRFNAKSISDLASFAADNNASLSNLSQQWIPLRQLADYAPLAIENEVHFLPSHHYAFCSDEKSFWAVRFVDFKLAGDAAPLSFAYPQIKRIIINQRKSKLLKKMYADLLSSAENDGKVRRLKADPAPESPSR